MANGSVNAAIQDLLIGNQVDLIKLEGTMRAQVLGVLKELEADLIKRLAIADPTAPALTKFQQQRLTRLLQQTQKVIGSSFATARRLSNGELLKLADLESQLATGSINTAIGTELGIPSLNRQTLQAIVNDGLIQGAPSREWWSKQAANTQAAFSQQMRLGVLAGENVGQLTNRVRELMNIPRHQAEALARTSTISVSNLARLRTYQENAHLIKAIKWLSTLDSRTTDICKGLDGLMWDPVTLEPIGHSVSFPGPTAHWNCRSTQIPITRSYEELATIKTKKAKSTAAKLQAAGAATRSALDGQVPSSINYEQWLLLKEADSPGFALNSGALTASKYSLWKQGKLDFKDLIDQSANPITVAELQEQLAGIIPVTATPEAALAAQQAAVTASGKFDSKASQAAAKGKTAQEAMDARVKQAQENAEVNAKKQARESLELYANKDTAPSSYHFNAFKDLVKQKGGKYIDEQRKVDPVGLLAQIDTKAAKKKLSTDIAHYKYQVLKGKKPSPAAQAAFDALPDEAAKDVLDAIKIKQAQEAAEAAAQKAAAEKAAAVAKANQEALDEIVDTIKNPEGKTVLAKELEKIRTDAELKQLSPSKQLELAKANAAETQAKVLKSVTLTGYKKKILSGEKPTPKQSQVVAELSGEELDTLSTALQQLEDNLQGYKNAIAGGIAPTKAQEKAAKFLTPKGKKALQTELDELKAAAPPTAVDTQAAAITQAEPVQEALVPSLMDLNAKGWKRVADKPGGSIPGAIYSDATGQRWVIKQVASDEIAKNEVLASRLYSLAGVDVADVRLIKSPDGRLWVASKFQKIEEVAGSNETKAILLRDLDGTYDGFAADAWLADWDTIGMTYDNLVIGPTGRALRIDVGASLRYRAQGGTKGNAFGDTVDELQSLRDPTINPQSHAVFKDIPEAKIEAGIAPILRITDDQIDELVDELGPESLLLRDNLRVTIKARRDDLAARYPHLAAKKSKPTPQAGQRVTDEEVSLIQNGRANGFALRTDKDQIEDQMVTVMEYKDEAGKIRTRAVLKIRGEAGRSLQQSQLANVRGGLAPIKPSKVDSLITTAARGIGALARDGKELRVTDITRVTEVVSEYQAVRKQVEGLVALKQLPASTLKEMDEFYSPWITRLQDAVKAGAGTQAKWSVKEFFEGGYATAMPTAAKQTAEAAAFKWQRFTDRWHYPAANFNKSNMKLSKASPHEMQGSTGNRFEGVNVNGTKVTYFDYGSNNSFSAEGWTMLDVAGGGKKAVDKLFDALDDMNINTARATELDLEELYLNRTAFGMMIKTPDKWVEYQLLDGIANQADRLAKKHEFFKSRFKLDIKKTDAYKETVTGIHQAFEGGRFYQYRPDYKKAEIAAFDSKYVLYHNPNGLDAFPTSGILPRLKRMVSSGGQLRSLTERMRLGITPGTTSAFKDMNVGGGSYVFLRIQDKANQFSHTGLFWKPKVARRADAVSYPNDQFGEVTLENQRNYRAVTMKQIGANSRNRNNETIFKDGMSFYDDLSHIVFRDRSEWQEALDYFSKNGFDEWPDGRPLAEVLTYRGRPVPIPPG